VARVKLPRTPKPGYSNPKLRFWVQRWTMNANALLAACLLAVAVAAGAGSSSEYSFPNDDDYDDDGGDDDDDGTHYVDDPAVPSRGHRFLAGEVWKGDESVGSRGPLQQAPFTLDIGLLLPLQGPTCVRGAELFEAILIANVSGEHTCVVVHTAHCFLDNRGTNGRARPVSPKRRLACLDGCTRKEGKARPKGVCVWGGGGGGDLCVCSSSAGHTVQADVVACGVGV
jgi:hypothetical protein